MLSPNFFYIISLEVKSMNIIIGIGLIFLLFFLTIFFLKKKIEEKIIEIYKNKEKKYLEIYEQRINELDKNLLEKRRILNELILQEEKNKELKIKEIQKDLENIRRNEKIKINYLLEEEKRNKQEKILKEIENFSIEQNKIKEQISLNISELTKTLEDYQQKQETINNEILRKKQIEENQDFFRVCLDENTISDINILNNVRTQLRNNTLIDKFIYDCYISKPVNEMIKRVTLNSSVSGIYKITRLKTGEIYIGKTTDIKNRFQQHAKSCFHCGTISHSNLHTIMKKDGIQNFTFEILEKVEKDKLNEREKYWIDFYDTTKFGLNERRG